MIRPGVGLKLLILCALIVLMPMHALAEPVDTLLEIRLSDAQRTLGPDSVNNSFELRIAAADYQGTYLGIPQQVQWIASDSALVSLSPDPADPSKCVVTATGRALGSCTVTAKCGQVSAGCRVTVVPTVRAKKLSLKPGTLYLSADSANNRYQLKPVIAPVTASALDPSRNLARWRTSNSRLATISQGGVLTIKRTGTLTISCTLMDGSKKKASAKLVIKKLKLSSIALPDQTVALGQVLKLEPALTPKDALSRDLKWRSADTKIAQVSSSGLVKPVRVGTVQITCAAVDGKARAECTLTVVAAPVATAGSQPGATPVASPSPSPSPTPEPSPTVSPTPSPSPSASPSPSPSPTPKYFVYALGNSNYAPSLGMGTLPSGALDAARIGALYEKARFPDGSAKVEVLVNRTGDQIRELFARMAEAGGVSSGSVSILYYSGFTQGSPDTDKHGALMGIDGVSITVDTMKKLLDEVPGQVLLILDCNFSGRFVEPGALALPRRMDAINRVFTASKYKLLMACSASGEALASGNASDAYGIFTRQLLNGLLPGLAADADGNGQVTLKELHNYARQGVNEHVANMNRLLPFPLSQTVAAWPENDGFVVYAG